MHDQDKILFVGDIESKISGLNFQHERILNMPSKELWEKRVSPVHDVDFYVIILRRLYRMVENAARIDSRVADLKGKNKDLLGKIKIRDHFEHEIDIENFSPTLLGDLPAGAISGPKGTSIKIATSLIGNTIVSENFQWNLEIDHQAFMSVLEQFVTLYPFTKSKKEIINYYKGNYYKDRELEDKGGWLIGRFMEGVRLTEKVSVKFWQFKKGEESSHGFKYEKKAFECNFITKGKTKGVINDELIELEAGEYVAIPPGMISNLIKEVPDFVEGFTIKSPSLLKEDSVKLDPKV